MAELNYHDKEKQTFLGNRATLYCTLINKRSETCHLHREYVRPTFAVFDAAQRFLLFFILLILMATDGRLLRINNA